MIRFSLRCDQDHGFESWFRDGQSYDALAGAGHISCPECGSTSVGKALMAPAVVTSRRRAIALPAEREAAPAPVQPQAGPVALADERAQMMRAMLRELRDHVVQQSRDVGEAFASEARRMHEGETEQAAIRGVAAPDEVRALLEDGIEVMPLPTFPDDRN